MAGPPPTKLVVGLGNPGANYEKTRHNVGFAVIDDLAARLGATFAKEKFRSRVAECTLAGRKVILQKPQTYMNRSGEAVAEALRYTAVTSDEVLVVYDDFDLPVGRLRLRIEGGPGTHNGMRSVIAHLGTETFPRLRVGVGSELRSDLTSHVLGSFAPDELPLIREAIGRAAECVLRCIDGDWEEAMNEFNRQPEPGQQEGISE